MIQLLQAWNGFQPGVYPSAGKPAFSAAEESRLAGLGLARLYTSTVDGAQVPSELVAPLLTLSSAAAPANRLAIQAAINSAFAAGSRKVTVGGVFGRVYFDETICIADGVELELQTGVEMYITSPTYKNLLRAGNVALSGTITRGRSGFLPLCATEDAVGVGSLQFSYTAGAPAANRVTTVAYKAPGDAAFGAVVTLSTGGVNQLGKGVLTSGNGTSKLWFFCDPLGTGLYSQGLNPDNATFTEVQAVTVHPLKGARPVTWTRTGGVVTVTEANHGRVSNDRIEMMTTATRGGLATALVRIAYIISPSQYAYFQAGGDLGTQAGYVYGVYNVRLTGGGRWNADKFAKSALYNDHNAFGIYFNGVSRLHIDGQSVDRAAAHAFHLTAWSGYVSPNDGYVFYDYVHVNGPCSNATIVQFAAATDDNLLGIGLTDYSSYMTNLPGEGTDIEDLTMVGATCADAYEVLRLYGCSGGPKFRNITLRDSCGMVTGNTTGEGNRIAGALMTVKKDLECFQGADTLVDGLLVQNFRVQQYPGVFPSTAVLEFAAASKNIVVDGMDVYPTVLGGSGVSIPAGPEDIVLRSLVSRSNADGTAFRNWLVGLANGAVLKRMRLESASIVVLNPTVHQGGGVLVAAGTTITDLVIDSIDIVCTTGNLSDMLRVDGTVGTVTVLVGKAQGLSAGVFISGTGIVGTVRYIDHDFNKPSGSAGALVATTGGAQLGALEMDGVTGSVWRPLDHGSTAVQTTRITARACGGLTQTAPPNCSAGAPYNTKLALQCDSTLPFDLAGGTIDNWVTKTAGVFAWNTNASFMYGAGMYVGNGVGWAKAETGWMKYTVRTGAYTALRFEDVVADATAGTFPITLSAGAAVGHRWRVTNAGTANNVTLAAGTSNTFAAGSSSALTPGQTAQFECFTTGVVTRLG